MIQLTCPSNQSHLLTAAADTLQRLINLDVDGHLPAFSTLFFTHLPSCSPVPLPAAFLSVVLDSFHSSCILNSVDRLTTDCALLFSDVGTIKSVTYLHVLNCMWQKKMSELCEPACMRHYFIVVIGECCCHVQWLLQ